MQPHNNKNNAPQRACIFSETVIETFTDDPGKDEFRIIGYSGNIIKNHWYWGNVAFDLKGMRFAKEKTPVLEEHFTSARLGFATSQSITDKVEVRGRYLDNANAQQLKSDIAKGFPMEASLYVPPSIVEYVKEGESTQVNGQTLTGPGAVFRKSVVKEVSMCVFGADSDTAVTGFNDKENVNFNTFEREKVMAEKATVTIETFKAEQPDIYQEIFDIGRAEGEKAERDLFAELKDASGTDSALLIEAFEQGKTKLETLQMRNTKLAAALADKDKKPAQTTDPDPAIAEFSDKQEPQKPAANAEEQTDEDLKTQYSASKDLQNEFGGAANYIAFIRAEQNGQITTGKKD